MTGTHLCCITWDMLQFLFPGESWAVPSKHWELQMFLPWGAFHSPLVPDHYLELGRELCLHKASQERAPLLNYPLYKSRDAILPPGWDFTSIPPSLSIGGACLGQSPNPFHHMDEDSVLWQRRGLPGAPGQTHVYTPPPQHRAAPSHPSQPGSHLSLHKAHRHQSHAHSSAQPSCRHHPLPGAFRMEKKHSEQLGLAFPAREGPPGDFLGAEEEQLHSSAQCQPLSRV